MANENESATKPALSKAEGPDGKDAPAPASGDGAGERGETEALDLLRGEVNDVDLAELETAIDAIDFAARKAAPERLAKLRAAHARLGDVLDQIEKGVRKRADAAPLKPEDEERVKALVDEAVALGESGKMQDALAKLDAAMRIDPENVDALFNVGVVYGLLGHKARGGDVYSRGVRDEVFTEKAMSSYERVLELDPENVHALNNLATLYALRDEADLAIETLKRSLAVDPAQADVKRQLEELEGRA